MKLNKKIALSITVAGTTLLTGCFEKDNPSDLNYLSTTPITVSLPLGGGSASGTTDNVIWSWTAGDVASPLGTATVKCARGYGYVERVVAEMLAVAESSAADFTKLVTSSQSADLYASALISIPTGSAATGGSGDNNLYAYNVSQEGGTSTVNFTCVPLATDANWAGN